MSSVKHIIEFGNCNDERPGQSPVKSLWKADSIEIKADSIEATADGITN